MSGCADQAGCRWGRRGLFLIAALLYVLAGPAAPGAELPWTTFSAVVCDNDDHRDVYTDEYLMALAHNGEIKLHALITTYAANESEYRTFVEGRRRLVELARDSGLRGVPIALAGTSQRLTRPASNRIADTVSLELPAAKRLVEMASEADPSKPMIVVSGGQLTTIADAYLQDPSIAERVVVSGVFGALERDYNAGLDGWAWTIVLSRFRTLAIPIGPPGRRGAVYRKPPLVPKARLQTETPQGIPFFRWMFEKRHPTNELPDGADYDGQAAIPLLAPDYITAVRRWRPDGVKSNGEPRLVADPTGPIFEAVDANQTRATREFWRAVGKAAESFRRTAQ